MGNASWLGTVNQACRLARRKIDKYSRVLSTTHDMRPIDPSRPRGADPRSSERVSHRPEHIPMLRGA